MVGCPARPRPSPSTRPSFGAPSAWPPGWWRWGSRGWSPSTGPRRRWRSAGRRASTAACSSPTGTRPAPPSPPGCCPAPARWSWGRCPTRAARWRAPSGPGPSGRSPATPRPTTTAGSARPWGASPPTSGTVGHRTRVVADDNGLVDRAAAHRAGLGWFGRTPTCSCRGTAAGSCSARWSPTPSFPPPSPSPTAAGPAAAASTAAPRAPSSAPASSTPAAAWRGWCRPRGRSPSSTVSPSAAGSTAATTARRSARPPVAGPEGRAAGAVPRGPGSTCSSCSTPPTTSCWPATAGGTSPDGTPATCAATRSSPSATWPTPATGWSGRARAVRPGRRRPARRARPLGPRPALGPPEGPVRHLLVTNDFPPKIGGIQSYLWELWRRLPRRARRSSPRPDGATGPSTPPSPCGSSGTGPGCCFRPRALARRIDRLAAEVDAEVVLLDPALPLGLLGPWLERPYGVVLHGAEVTVPGPGARPAAGPRAGAAGRPDRGRGRRLPRGRGPSRRPVAAAHRRRPSGRRPGALHTRSTGPPDGRCGPRLGLDPDAELVLGRQPARPPQGVRRGARGGRRPSAPPPPPAGRPGRRRARPAAPRAHRRPPRRPRPVPRARPRRRPGRGCTRRRTCSPCCAVTGGWGSSRRASGSSSSRRPPRGTPSVAGHSGGSGEAVVDGVTGLVVDDPRDVGEVATALDELLSDPDRRRRMGDRGPSARRRRSTPTTCSPAG